jgi:hypothetical protein
LAPAAVDFAVDGFGETLANVVQALGEQGVVICVFWRHLGHGFCLAAS